ncbi:hypothetical protein [Vibrio crassostreae]|uniref:hypothetical protein n=1 Tax=Vibrio crassostreae TaxID=246167 RepID=UPI002FE238A7
MFVSKIVTFNKIGLLNNLSSQMFNSQSFYKEYFNIGHPIDSPPTLRGSMIVEFNLSFIFDNEEFFEYGSPIDIGSLMAGYIKVNNFEISDIKMDFFNFRNILTDIINTSENDKKDFLRHEITATIHNILKKHTNVEVANFIKFDKNPHSRLFEFCLNDGYKIEDKHVRKIHIPNTYSDSYIVRRISNRFKEKIATFNPKYGFEGRNVA